MKIFSPLDEKKMDFLLQKISFIFVHFKQFSEKARFYQFLDYELFEKLIEPS